MSYITFLNSNKKYVNFFKEKLNQENSMHNYTLKEISYDGIKGSQTTTKGLLDFLINIKIQKGLLKKEDLDEFESIYKKLNVEILMCNFFITVTAYANYIAPAELEENYKEGLLKIVQYNKDIDKLNEFITKNFKGEQIESVTTDYYNRKTFTKTQITNFLFSKYNLNKNNITKYKYLLNNLEEFKNSQKTKEEFSSDTTNSFLVYCNKTGQEGFLNKNTGYGPLASAEFFPDENKAKRACSSRGYVNYQIYRASISFDKMVYNNNCENGKIIKKITSEKEKEMIEFMFANQNYIKLKNENELFKKILEENNLLPKENQEDEVKSVKKMNKL